MKTWLSVCFIGLSVGSALSRANGLEPCTFERPLLLGASISAGYSSIRDAAKGAIATQSGLNLRGGSWSPGEALALIFAPKAQVTNIAEVVNTLPHSAFANRQYHSAKLDPLLSEKISAASIIFSLDGSYWPSVFGLCDEAIEGYRLLIDHGREKNIPVVLATIPDEDPAKVSWHIQQRWAPPKKSCVARANAYLIGNCLAKDHCYVVDLYSTVNRLNSEGIYFGGVLNKTYDLRFDGIHLSRMGVRYVMSLIVTALQQNPPKCGELKN